MSLSEFQEIKVLEKYVKYINDLIGEGKNLEQIVRIISRKARFRVPKEIIRRVYRNVTFASLDNEIKAAGDVTFDLLDKYKRKYRAEKDKHLHAEVSVDKDCKVSERTDGYFAPDYWPSKGRLVKLYCDVGESIKRIAEIEGFCTNTIRKMFRFYGIKTRGNSESKLPVGFEKPTKEELEFYYNELRMNVEEIARELSTKEYKLWRKTIHRWIDSYGIKKRDSSASHLSDRAWRPTKKELLDLYIDEGISGGAVMCGTSKETFERWLEKEEIRVSKKQFRSRKDRENALIEFLKRGRRTIEELSIYDFYGSENNGLGSVLNYYTARFHCTPQRAFEYLIREFER